MLVRYQFISQKCIKIQKYIPLSPQKEIYQFLKKNLDDQFDECSNIMIIEKAVCEN